MNQDHHRPCRLAAGFVLAASLVASTGCNSGAGTPPASAPPARASSSSTGSLSSALAPVFERAERDGQGRLGVAVVHVESGERASFRGDERFPMQSVFKLPLAIEVLARVDAGELRLDDELRIEPSDVRPGPGGALADELPATGGERSVLDLVERMMIRSDNTAADVLLDRVGGARRVTERLRGLGIDGIDVSRSEAELMMDFTGVTARPPRKEWTLSNLSKVTATPPETRTRALAAYLKDPRDTATPVSAADLLVRVHRRDLLGKGSSALLVSIMERTTTGKSRLKGLLPSGTTVAHKTGMSDTTDGIVAATNDVGIVSLPEGVGHVVIAAFVSGSRGDDKARDHAIATVSRAVFDHYVQRGP